MSALPTRTIGSTPVSAIGYGAMGLGNIAYGAQLSDEDRLKFLDEVYASGCTFWDTADCYADSEELGSHARASAPIFFLATKFGFFTEKGSGPPCGTPEHARACLASSLKLLGVDTIDLFYLHRADKNTPIEETVSAMKEFVESGKVRYLGLSEVSASTLRRAHAIHPIAAVQVEYSPFTLDIEDPTINLLTTARELGVKIIAYSPLGRGLLTGQYKSPADFGETDFRRYVPRYSASNFPNILKLVSGLSSIGARHDASAGQVALAWLLAQGEDVIPIPGTTKSKYLKENLASLSVTLTPGEVQEIRAIAANADAAQGDRYPPGMSETLFVDTPEWTGRK